MIRIRASRIGAMALLVAGFSTVAACNGGGKVGSGDSTAGSSGASGSSARPVGWYRAVDDLCVALGDAGLPGEHRGSIPVTSDGVQDDPSTDVSCSFDSSDNLDSWRLTVDATIFEAARGCHWLNVQADNAKEPAAGAGKPGERRKFTRTGGRGIGEEGFEASIRRPLVDSSPGPVDQLTLKSGVCDGNLQLVAIVEYGVGPAKSADYPGALDRGEEAARKKADEMLKRASEKLYQRETGPRPTAS